MRVRHFLTLPGKDQLAELRLEAPLTGAGHRDSAEHTIQRHARGGDGEGSAARAKQQARFRAAARDGERTFEAFCEAPFVIFRRTRSRVNAVVNSIGRGVRYVEYAAPGNDTCCRHGLSGELNPAIRHIDCGARLHDHRASGIHPHGACPDSEFAHRALDQIRVAGYISDGRADPDFTVVGSSIPDVDDNRLPAQRTAPQQRRIRQL